MSRRWTQRDEDLVVDRVRRDRVRADPRRHVLDPLVGHRVDDPEDRTGRVVAGGHVVVLVAWVVPDLVRAADVADLRDHITGARIHYLDRARVAAADQQLLLRAEREPRRPAALDVNHAAHGGCWRYDYRG